MRLANPSNWWQKLPNSWLHGAKVAVWSIEQASSIQRPHPFHAHSPSLSLVTLWRQKGERMGGCSEKNTCPPAGNRCYSIETNEEDDPSEGGPRPDEPLKVELLATLAACRSVGRVSPCVPAGHALGTLGNLHHDETRISPQLFNEYMNTNI